MTHKSTYISLLFLTGLSACASSPNISATASTPALQSHTATFGQAVQHNTIAQHVAPTDAQKANTYIPANRDRRALAIKRYKEDDVEELQTISTLN